MREGEGTFKYTNGDIYSGMWQANKRHGAGTYVFTKTRYSYVGEWKDTATTKFGLRSTVSTQPTRQDRKLENGQLSRKMCSGPWRRWDVNRPRNRLCLIGG